VKIEFWAKTNPPQTVQEHTKDALDIYERFRNQHRNLFDDAFWMLLRLAVLYHDCGKADFSFRKYLDDIINGLKPSKQGNFIHHNYLSPAFLPKHAQLHEISDEDYAILVNAIFYHHARPEVEISRLSQYIRDVLDPVLDDFQMDGLLEIDKLNTKFMSRIAFRAGSDPIPNQIRYILLKGLLNRIDYAASAGILRDLDLPIFDKAGRNVYEATACYINSKGYKKRAVQRYMEENADKNVIVTAATGSGKTEAALLWIKDCKAFYTLPLKVSINAIYDRIVKDINYDPTGLLHSDAQRVYRETWSEAKMDTSDEIVESPELQYESARLLAYPLTVCTVDQILDFAYKYNGGEAAAATLSYSKLVIDEIQMYSPNMVATILTALKTITDMGGRFAIITATFPPILFKLMHDVGIGSFEQSVVFHSEYTHRHRISLLEGQEFDFEKIVEIAKHKKVLVLVNTVKQAQFAYEKIVSCNATDDQSVGILHASFIRIHRKEIEKSILNFAPNSESRPSEPGIWISTQIVEASLDLDFDVLFTEMCGIDSLFQRMGRVFRSRIYSGAEPNVYILDNRNGVGKKSIIDSDVYRLSLAAVTKMKGKLLEESDEQDDKQDMISMVYGGEEIIDSEYYRSIKQKTEMLCRLPMYATDKAEVKSMFRDIDAKTVMPKQIYDELEESGTIKGWRHVLTNSKSSEEKQSVRDEIMEYTLSISHYCKDIKLGLMKNVSDPNNELFYKGSRIFLHYGEYDYKIAGGKATGRGLIRALGSNIL